VFDKNLLSGGGSIGKPLLYVNEILEHGILACRNGGEKSFDFIYHIEENRAFPWKKWLDA
jgi:hypothetical protein